MRAKKGIAIILFIFLLLNNILFAQVEYFVQVNPTTCSYTILDSIPIIKWIGTGSSTFDKINKRFIFYGLDNGSGRYLCSVDATTGNTVSIPAMTGNFQCLKFDNSTGILYGIHWSTALANADFVSINPVNLSFTVIHHINLTGIGSDVTFDNVNHRYILAADDSLGISCLFSIDVTTGNIVSKPTLAKVGGILFDNSSGNLYGIHQDSNTFIWYFVSVNITNGNITIINSIPLITSTGMGFNTFDELNKHYTFQRADNSNNNYLFTLDATNGNVFSNPLFPIFVAPYNLLETEYDNSTGNLYALHWGPYGETTGIKNYSQSKDNINIYPNPCSENFTIETISTDKQTADLFDINGRLVFSKIINDKTNIDVSILNEGVYTLTIKTADAQLNKKLVILR